MCKADWEWIVQGYPSIGDVQSTVPVPVEKWYEYAGERSGRFQVQSHFACAFFETLPMFICGAAILLIGGLKIMRGIIYW